MSLTKNQMRYSIYIILVLLISYFSFFDDYFEYLNVKKYGTSEACRSYYSRFPDGYFTEEVKVIEIKDDRDIVLVREFFKNYPNSEYSSDIELINLEIWNNEIKRYDSITQSNNRFDENAVIFFKELLTYMRDNKRSEIFIKLNGNVNVKDFESYPNEIKDAMDLMHEYLGDRPVTGHIVNITSNYDPGAIEHYEEIIHQSILNSFENLLSDNFISVGTFDDSNNEKNDLIISIEYEIENQETTLSWMDGIYPEIWEYVVAEKFESYLIGISIKFNFLFELTNSEYAFSLQTNALDNISNIQNISEGYRRMTEQNFQNFADGILVRFGIENN